MSFLDCDLRITQGVSNVSEVLALEIMQPQDFLVLIGQCRPFQQIIKSGYIRDVLELPSGVKMTAQIKHPLLCLVPPACGASGLVSAVTRTNAGFTRRTGACHCCPRALAAGCPCPGHRSSCHCLFRHSVLPPQSFLGCSWRFRQLGIHCCLSLPLCLE